MTGGHSPDGRWTLTGWPQSDTVALFTETVKVSLHGLCAHVSKVTCEKTATDLSQLLYTASHASEIAERAETHARASPRGATCNFLSLSSPLPPSPEELWVALPPTEYWGTPWDPKIHDKYTVAEACAKVGAETAPSGGGGQKCAKVRRKCARGSKTEAPKNHQEMGAQSQGAPQSTNRSPKVPHVDEKKMRKRPRASWANLW